MGITQQIGASSIIKPGVIDNAAARPASPYEGQVIFQKDTDQLLVWNGTTWVIPNSPAQNPQGLEIVATGTASAQNRLNIPSCFSSTYTNYRVEVDNLTHSTANNLIMRLSIAGSDTSGSAYYTQRSEVNASAVSGISLTASSAIFPTYANSTAGSFVTLSFDVFRPNVASPTSVAGQAARIDATTGLYAVSFSGLQSDSTAFDGISLVGNTGNITCVMRVYGYRNS
jgi:hypothetical protein